MIARDDFCEDLAGDLEGYLLGGSEVESAEYMGDGVISVTMGDGTHLNLNVTVAS